MLSNWELRYTDQLPDQMKNNSLGKPIMSFDILVEPNSLRDSKQQAQEQSKSYIDDDYCF